MLYVIVVTDEDGVEMAFGPWSKTGAEVRAKSLQSAYKRAAVRVLGLLTGTHGAVSV